ncbi:hypothetical protein [Streptomyces sp. NPDC060194]
MRIVHTLSRRGRDTTSTTELPGLLGRPATTLGRWAAGDQPVFESRSWT